MVTFSPPVNTGAVRPAVPSIIGRPSSEVEGVCEGVALSVCDGVVVGEGVALAVKDGVCVTLPGCDAVWLGVCVPVSERLCVCVVEGVSVGDAVGGALGVPVSEGVNVAVRLGVPLPVSEGDCVEDGVVVGVAVSVALGVSVGDGVCKRQKARRGGPQVTCRPERQCTPDARVFRFRRASVRCWASPTVTSSNSEWAWHSPCT